MNREEVARGFDAVAREYQARIGNELAGKPFDRDWLKDFVNRLAAGSRVLEVGCGDGHVTQYLADLGANIIGSDLSARMIVVARETYPGIEFRQADMTALPFDDASFDAIVSAYSIVNLEPTDCSDAFREARRVIRPGGLLTVAFHIGEGIQRIENWWETGASLDFYFHDPADISARLEAAGFRLVRAAERGPYSEEVETQTQRAYLMVERLLE